VKRRRRVYGRRVSTVGGSDYRIELRADGVWVREKWARKERHLTFADVVDLAFGQLSFRLQ
jgi:hypothetical protein